MKKWFETKPTNTERFGRALSAGDLETAKKVVAKHPEILKDKIILVVELRSAAGDNDVRVMEYLVDVLGADINEGIDERSPEGPISMAVGEGAIDAARWLLERGARVNVQVNGKTRCSPLSDAAREGNIAMVRLLVEHGADFNAVWADQNALSFAIAYGQKEVEAYLRSIGAREPHELSKPRSAAPDPILAHVVAHVGKPKRLTLRQVVPADVPVSILLVAKPDMQVLVTSGMSARAMTVPPGGEGYRHAELVMFLPRDWPLTGEALRQPENRWPVEWLRRIAEYPHKNRTWLGGPTAVFANGKPPRPLASNTRLSCLLAATWESDFARLSLRDGREVCFYTVFPLYKEERDLERERGTEHLMALFNERGIMQVVDVDRPNVARR